MRRPASPPNLVVPLLAAALLGACSDPSGPGGGEPIDRLPRALTATETTLVERTRTFGVELAARVVESDERANVVLSPLSATLALGMALNGASGTTLEGMKDALGFQGMAREEINDAYRGLMDLLTGLDPSVELRLANSAWANETYPFQEAYFQRVVEHFDAEVRTLDFADPTTLDAVNGWVEEGTEGRIDRILDTLSPDLALLLLNALAFEGRWTTAFDPDDTRDQAFTREDGTAVTVRMMSLSDHEVAAGGTGELAAVELPYGGGAFTMVVAVPRGPRSAREVLADMDGPAWDSLVTSLAPREMDLVALPRFTVAYDAYLNDALSDMGMAEAFTRRADFSDLSPVALCVDYVRQKTFIEVDEAGTRAAAVTAVGIGPTSFNGFVADRPFLFAIRERLSGTLLFIGLVGDPTLEEGAPPEDPGRCLSR